MFFYFFSSIVQCPTAAVLSSLALLPCPWWRRSLHPTHLPPGPPTTTEGHCKATSGTWSACTSLDQEGMPGIRTQHRGATPASRSTSLPELFHSHTSKTVARGGKLTRCTRIRRERAGLVHQEVTAGMLTRIGAQESEWERQQVCSRAPKPCCQLDSDTSHAFHRAETAPSYPPKSTPPPLHWRWGGGEGLAPVCVHIPECFVFFIFF